jgi:hypothetical protein
MIFTRLDFIAIVFIGLGTSGMGSALAQPPGVARRPTQTATRAQAVRLPAAADVMYKYLKRLHPGELKWQEIPWLVDLEEGIRQAKAESRPILLWVSGDDPLERC